MLDYFRNPYLEFSLTHSFCYNYCYLFIIAAIVVAISMQAKLELTAGADAQKISAQIKFLVERTTSLLPSLTDKI